MHQVLMLCLVTGGAVQAISHLDLLVEEWETWKLIHGKTYGDQHKEGTNNVASPRMGQEEMFRMKIWIQNKIKIEKHNQAASLGEETYTLAMNQFGDLLHHEFVSMVNGYKYNVTTNTRPVLGATFLPPAHVDSLPENVDWREHGAVTPVKNQGRCGSCWSFSATGALEGMHYRKTGKLVSLSEQNLVDCSGDYGNHGCRGGFMDSAFNYIKNNGGIDTEASYPYEGKERQCRYDSNNIGATDIGFVDIESGNEDHLKAAVATQGPVSIAMDAGLEPFMFYEKGVYRNKNCNPMSLDHGVLAVGYGIDNHSGSAYWLVKNSWGQNWGMDGYVKIARNEGNMCGVATMASFPLV